MKRIIKGMLKMASASVLVTLLWGCTTVPSLSEETTGSYVRIPYVRVLLSNTTTQATISAKGAVAIECIRSGAQEVFYSSRPLVVTNEHGKLSVENDRRLLIQDNLDEVNILPRSNDGRLSVNGRQYRGLFKLFPEGENVEVINLLYIEDYLRGVVPSEIGDRTEEEIEAVKAQAVAARTYTMAHLEQYAGEDYDMKSTVADQLYDGVAVEKEIVNRAIDETAGRVATFQDDFIVAYYHSTCGGMTDNIEQVWDKKEIAYLKATPDSGACSWSKYYTWKETFSEPQLRGRLEQYLSADRGRDMKIGRILDISIREQTTGGRVSTLVVKTEDDTFLFHKDRIRWVVARASNPDLILPSDRFDVEILRDYNGVVDQITFVGRGYGHGVGMCQCGAIGMAREGKSFETILTHYYRGIGVKKFY